MARDLPSDESFCYVTTRGRTTGQPHEIEIWYAEHKGALYVLAGGGRNSDWVRNMEADPSVTVRIGDLRFPAVAEIDPPAVNETEVRQKLAAKYQGWEPGSQLSDWARTALIVEFRRVPGQAI